LRAAASVGKTGGNVKVSGAASKVFFKGEKGNLEGEKYTPSFNRFSYETPAKCSILWGLFFARSKPSSTQPNSCKLML
jgi:hypothetical protein